jgi:hypothetical protein
MVFLLIKVGKEPAELLGKVAQELAVESGAGLPVALFLEHF